MEEKRKSRLISSTLELNASIKDNEAYQNKINILENEIQDIKDCINLMKNRNFKE